MTAHKKDDRTGVLALDKERKKDGCSTNDPDQPIRLIPNRADHAILESRSPPRAVR
jgi:hypothetical protein